MILVMELASLSLQSKFSVRIIPKDQLSQLRAQYPEIYRDFVENKVYRTFEIRKTAC